MFPTWIVAPSDALCAFLAALALGLSAAQQQHLLNVIEALIISPAKHKTLAALTRLLKGPHADEYALADFFRVSPWSGEALRHAVVLFILKMVGKIQAKTGWRLLFLGVDDALCPKDVATHKLEAVGWHHDHVESRRQRKQNTNASRYVSLHLQLGPVQFALDWRLYLKRAQIKALNRQRRAQGLPALQYAKLGTLVKEMLTEITPYLPKGCKVYVLFDSWYDSLDLEKFIRAQGWHWICATRFTRRVSRYQLGQWWGHLGHQRIVPVTVRRALRSHTYSTRSVVGQLRRYPDPVIAIISKRNRRDYTPAYFLCSDTSLSVACILKYYGYRWQAEVDNWFLKERFGLADYRLQSLEAILRWHAVVFAAYAFLQAHRAQPLLTAPQATLAPMGEVIAQHQRGHACRMLEFIARLVRQGMSNAELIAALLP
jgi:hypothetical protein